MDFALTMIRMRATPKSNMKESNLVMMMIPSDEESPGQHKNPKPTRSPRYP